MDNTADGNGALLLPETIARGDPILQRLTQSGISPILSGVAYSVGFGLIVRGLVVEGLAGHLWTVGTITGYFNDPAVPTNLTFLAVIWAYYTWMPRGIAAVFQKLYDNEIIGDPIPREKDDKAETQDVRSFIQEMENLFGKYWWSGASLAIAASAVLLLIRPEYLAMDQSVYYTANLFSLFLALIWAGVGIYCTIHILILNTLSIYWLRRLFKSFKMKIRPLHPDRAGGLVPLGQYTLSLSYLIAAVGILLVVTPVTRNYVVVGTWQFRWTTELIVGLVAYLIVAPIVFFAPLSVAHGAMAKAKNQLLLQIAHRFDDEYEHIQGMLSKDSQNLPNLEENLENLKKLETLHNTTSKFPVWPFNLSNITRFGTTYLSPILLAILIDVLSNLVPGL